MIHTSPVQRFFISTAVGIATFVAAVALGMGQPSHAEEADVATAPALPGDAEYSQGVEALKAKDSATAISAFESCLAVTDASTERKADCHWELGWAYWTRGDWGQVVKHWEAVQQSDPGRDGLAGYLKQAKDNLGLQGLLAKGRSTAPATFQSDVPEGTTVRLRAVGDLMIGTDFPAGVLPPMDGATMFDDVEDWLTDADVTFGNLEGPVCDGGKTGKCKPDAKPGSCYAFRSPARYAKYYKLAGFDLLSTANNHAGDFGEYCRDQTEKNLDAQGIAHSGRPGDIASITVNGLQLAMIGFHTSRNSHYVNDHDQAAALVRALAAEHDIVVVSFHGGAEGAKNIHVPHGTEKFYGENRGNLREFTHVVVDAGADLVLGHGPHVLRGMEVYNDRLIAYSLGNFATYGRFNLSGNLGVGAVLEVTMAKDGAFVGGRILPTLQEGEGVPVKDPVTEDGGGKAIDLVRSLSESDFPTTGVRVAQDGTLGTR